MNNNFSKDLINLVASTNGPLDRRFKELTWNVVVMSGVQFRLPAFSSRFGGMKNSRVEAVMLASCLW